MKPFQHQQAALDKAAGHNYFAFFMDCGTGKSFTSILKAKEEKCQRVLIITYNSIKYNWQRELDKVGETDVVILEGSREKKVRSLQQGSRWVILNYDSVATIIKELCEWKFDCVILDESTAIKNPKAKRTKACHKLASARVRMLLTGTPMPDPLAVWSQMYFLNPSIVGDNYFAFLYTYAVTKEKFVGHRRFKEVVGYQNVEKLIQKIEPHVFFCKKEDCLDIPEKIYEVRTVEATAEMTKIYAGLNEEFIADLQPGSVATVDNALSKALRLQQLLGGAVLSTNNATNVDTWQAIPENKTSVLLEVLEEIGPRHKSVVFCRFISEIHKLKHVLTEQGIPCAVIYGEVPVPERDALTVKFKTDKDHRVLICQNTCAGYGIDLTGANYVIFYSTDWSVIVRQQDEDRVHRQGQKNQVTIIDLLTRFPGFESQDEMVYKAIQEKKSFEQYIKEIKWTNQ